MDETDSTGELQEEKPKMGGGASNFKPWLFQKGKSGNPNGRPKGSISLKTYAKKYLETLTDEEKLDFLDGLPKDIVWRMAEGQPHQTNEHDVRGNVVIQFHESFNKNVDTPQETAGSNQQ